MKPACRRAKKAAWKREKMRTDEQFRLDCKLSNQKWFKANPGYRLDGLIQHMVKGIEQ
jgi:hypothetical protein